MPCALELGTLDAVLGEISAPQHPAPIEAITRILLAQASAKFIPTQSWPASDLVGPVQEGFVALLQLEQAVVDELRSVEQDQTGSDSSPSQLPTRYPANGLVVRHLNQAVALHHDDESGRAAATYVAAAERRRDTVDPYVYGVEYGAALVTAYARTLHALFPTMVPGTPGPISDRLRAHPLTDRGPARRATPEPDPPPPPRGWLGRVGAVWTESWSRVRRATDAPSATDLVRLLERAVQSSERPATLDRRADRAWADVAAHPQLADYACIRVAVHLRRGDDALARYRLGAGVDALLEAQNCYRQALDERSHLRNDPGWEQLAGQKLAESTLEEGADLLLAGDEIAETIADAYLRVIQATERLFQRTFDRSVKADLQSLGVLAATRVIEAATFLSELPRSDADIWARRAFAVADLCKSRILRAQIAFAQRSAPAGVAGEVLAREAQLLEAMRDLVAKAESRTDDLMGDTGIAADAQREGTRLALESVWKEIEGYGAEATAYVRIRRDDAILDCELDWSPYADTVGRLGPTFLVVQLHRLPAGVLVAALRAGWAKPQLHVVPLSLQDMNDCIQSYNTSMHQQGQSPRSGLQWQEELGERIFGPLRQPLDEVESLYLLPHRTFHGMPMHAFKLDGEPIIKRKKVIYAPSLALLDATLARAPTDGPPVVLGCPGEGDLPALRESILAEAANVADWFKTAGMDPLYRPWAGRSALEELAPKARYLHFAGHGRFSSRDALSSRIDLGGSETFTVKDWLGLTLNAELVTLSACLTGIQELSGNDDGVGLAPAILFAGASSVLMTLASVSTHGAQAWMALFYSELLRAPGTATPCPVPNKAAAFQAATCELMTWPGYTEPRMWAPYILLGNYR